MSKKKIIIDCDPGYDDAVAVRLLVGGGVDERKLKAHRGVKVV